jgi:prepilin signal peptidase PulO-like enzyme (type II secretory pathway)
VRLSVAVVGFAHLVFALTFGMRAAQLARTAAPTMTVGSVFLWSVCASVIPWGLLFIPELLTLITGMLILPVLFGFTAIANRERDALPVLPVARRLS